MRAQSRQGFTLIELLVVITIIGILTALTLGGAKIVQDKAARSRAQGEVSAIELALERYKIDNGDYPSVSTLAPSSGLYPTNPTAANYRSAGKLLFEELMGRKKYTDLVEADRVQYIELKKGQVGTDTDSYIQDPWGFPYGYYYKYDGQIPSAANTNAKSLFNEVVPDFWSTSGETNTATLSTSDGEQHARYLRWTTNWPNK